MKMPGSQFAGVTNDCVLLSFMFVFYATLLFIIVFAFVLADAVDDARAEDSTRGTGPR